MADKKCRAQDVVRAKPEWIEELGNRLKVKKIKKIIIKQNIKIY